MHNTPVASLGEKKSVAVKITAKAKAKSKPKIVAKGKKRRQAREDDAALLDEHTDKIEVRESKETKAQKQGEIETREIVNIMADEIEEIYSDYGSNLDRMNSEDKARTILLEMKYKDGGIKIKERDVKLRHCKAHR